MTDTARRACRPVKHPEIEVQLSGEDRDAYTAESVSGDYDNLLRVAMEWVTVL